MSNNRYNEIADLLILTYPEYGAMMPRNSVESMVVYPPEDSIFDLGVDVFVTDAGFELNVEGKLFVKLSNTTSNKVVMEAIVSILHNSNFVLRNELGMQ